MMEIPTSPTGIASLATAMSQRRLEEEVGVTVLKKSIDLQEQAAMQLIQSLPTPAPALPDQVGVHVDVTA